MEHLASFFSSGFALLDKNCESFLGLISPLFFVSFSQHLFFSKLASINATVVRTCLSFHLKTIGGKEKKNSNQFFAVRFLPAFHFLSTKGFRKKICRKWAKFIFSFFIYLFIFFFCSFWVVWHCSIFPRSLLDFRRFSLSSHRGRIHYEQKRSFLSKHLLTQVTFLRFHLQSVARICPI